VDLRPDYAENDEIGETDQKVSLRIHFHAKVDPATGRQIADSALLNAASTDYIFEFLEHHATVFDWLQIWGNRIMDDAVLDIFRRRFLSTGIKRFFW
jgi:hypothetical protein